MSKFKDFFSIPTEGIFTFFEDKYPEQFAELFHKTAEQMNVLVHAKYGERTMAGYVRPDNWETLIDTTICFNVENWLRVRKLMTEEYNPLQPFSKTTVRTGETSDNWESEKEKLSGKKSFNQPEFAFDQTEQNTDTKKQTRQDDWKETVESSDSKHTVAGTMRSEIELRKYEQQSAIVKRLVDELTLSIYE